MASKKDRKKKFAEYLWTEINRAILTSPEAKFPVRQLQALGLLEYVSEYNLVLEVDKLIEKIVKEAKDITVDELSQLKKDFLEVDNSGEIDLASNEKTNKKMDSEEPLGLNTCQWVEGKLLIDNEMLFEQYLREKFNEEEWVRQTKIRL